MGKATEKKPSGKTGPARKLTDAHSGLILQDVPRRDSVLYARVSDVNKNWVEEQAAKHKVTVSLFMELFLDQCRKK